MNRYKHSLIISSIFLLLHCTGFAQILDSLTLADRQEFTSLYAALQKPDSVYKLNFKKQKLKEIPKEVFLFKNLQELNLSKNKITNIPKEIGTLTNLQKLDLSMNSIDSLPKEIGKLVNIKDLILNQNIIAKIPPEISNLVKMRFIDLWGNEIQEFPDEISKLSKTIQVVDLRVISIRPELQEKIEQQLPYTKIYFSFSCNCN